MPVTEILWCGRESRHTHQLPHSEQFPNWSSTQAHIIGEGFGFGFIHFPFSILFLFSNLVFLFYQQLMSLKISTTIPSYG